MVKRRLKKEGKDPGDFQLSARAWGTRIPNTAFVEHKGQFYVEVIFIKAGAVMYELDGVECDIDTIEGAPEDREPTGQGGLVNQVIIRTLKCESITRIRNHGVEYIDG